MVKIMFSEVFFVSDYKRSAKISLAVTYLFMVMLAAMTVSLPFITMWYVETMGRPKDLATTVMLTCYPCVPFAAVALASLRKFLINIIKENVFDMQNVAMLSRISNCCFVAAAVMLVAGFFYMPFYIASASAATCALVARAVKNMLHTIIVKKEEEK